MEKEQVIAELDSAIRLSESVIGDVAFIGIDIARRILELLKEECR